MQPSTLLVTLTILKITKFFITNIITLSVVAARLSPLLNKSLHQQLKITDDEIKTIKKEQLTVSPQDQYAKWTKLNRKLDKLTATRENILKQNQSLDGTTQKWIKNLNFLIFTLSLWYLRLWYRSLDLFYLPNDTFPSLTLYTLSFPSGKCGVVKISQWLFFLNLLLTNLHFVYITLTKSLPPYPAHKVTEITENATADQFIK